VIVLKYIDLNSTQLQQQTNNKQQQQTTNNKQQTTTSESALLQQGIWLINTCGIPEDNTANCRVKMPFVLVDTMLEYRWLGL
jgi:hypothetical protein